MSDFSTTSADYFRAVTVQLAPFSAADVLEKISLMFKAKMQGQGLTFTEVRPKEDILVVGDRHRLSQASIL